MARAGALLSRNSSIFSEKSKTTAITMMIAREKKKVPKNFLMI
jgi:hypothetical protein